MTLAKYKLGELITLCTGGNEDLRFDESFVKRIVEDMSRGQASFSNLFNAEFKTLTEIGNDYRIRHHETNKIDITDIRHYDYFFNRCLALIATAIQYLN